MPNTLRILTVSFLVLLIAGCGQRDNHRNRQNQNNTTMQSGGQMQPNSQLGGRPRLREACTTEIQQYCGTDQRKFRCLRQNRDKLGAACRTAFDQMREWRHEHRMQRGNNSPQGQQPQNGNSPKSNGGGDDDEE